VYTADLLIWYCQVFFAHLGITWLVILQMLHVQVRFLPPLRLLDVSESGAHKHQGRTSIRKIRTTDFYWIDSKINYYKIISCMTINGLVISPSNRASNNSLIIIFFWFAISSSTSKHEFSKSLGYRIWSGNVHCRTNKFNWVRNGCWGF
jgi:hypothetical protein